MNSRLKMILNALSDHFSEMAEYAMDPEHIQWLSHKAMCYRFYAQLHQDPTIQQLFGSKLEALEALDEKLHILVHEDHKPIMQAVIDNIQSHLPND